MTFEEAVNLIGASAARGKGGFAICDRPAAARPENIASLVVGSASIVALDKGFVITIGLTREQLQRLVDEAKIYLEGS